MFVSFFDRRPLALVSATVTLLTYGNSWGLGVCIPHLLVKHLANNHPRMRSLEFITDSRCPGSGASLHETSLANVRFFELRRLSWTGPPNGLSLGELIHTHVRQLEELEIDWPLHNIQDCGPMDKDHWLIPAIRQGTGPILYPIMSPMLRGLQALCLCRIPLRDQLLADILDFSRLESLTFRDCRGWDEAVSQTFQKRG